MDKATLKLQRFIAQVLFRPTMLSFSAVSKIAGPIEKDFSDWQANKSEDVFLYSEENKKYFNIAFDKLTYSSEEVLDLERIKEQVNLYLTPIFNNQVNEGAIKEVRRVGARFVRIFEMRFNFSDTVDLIQKKFYSPSPELASISGGAFRDNVFILESFKNGFANRAHIGPLKPEMVFSAFGPTFKPDISLSKTAYIYLDIDVFQGEGLAPVKATDVLTSLMEEADSISAAYIDYLFT